jgi:chromosome partitioning protein
MLTIALISQKGGVGKTTLAIHLATAFEAKGHQTLLVDLDPQTSAAEWKDARQAERPYVMAVPPSRLAKTLEAAQENQADRSVRAGDQNVDHHVIDPAHVRDGSIRQSQRVIERAGAVHGDETRAEDREPHDLTDAPVLHGDR